MKTTILSSHALAAAAAFLVAAATADAAGAPASAAVGSDPSAAARSATGNATFRKIKWEELMPKDWDPAKRFRNQNTMIRNDSDPRARKLLEEMREVWDMAPTVDAMEGVAVKLAGYVVPLEEAQGELKEFLLVPYFGACIHMPPPPANQIVFVRTTRGAKFRAMETVVVSGTMRTTRQASYMGASGYRIEAAAVERYSPP